MWRKATLATGSYIGLTTAANVASPLKIVWDLDETLVSSSQQKSKWREDQKNQILKRTTTTLEHVDDDGLHFITTARPLAGALVRALSWVPGVEQHVSTAASPGYAKNVVRLLDPENSIFKTVRADQPSSGKDLEAQGFRGRAVLVDNRPSCHAPQPQRGLLVDDYVASERVLHLSGGRYAVGGAFRVRATDRALEARWPLEPRTLSDGSAVGGGATIEGGALVGRPRHLERKREKQLRRTRTAEENELADRRKIVHKLAVAAVEDSGDKARLRALVADAKSSGAAALLLVDANRREPAKIPHEADFPVVSAGASAAHVLANQHARNAAPSTTITTAELKAPEDVALRGVAAKLLLCWFAPDVSWALTPVDSSAEKARAAW